MAAILNMTHPQYFDICKIGQLWFWTAVQSSQRRRIEKTTVANSPTSTPQIGADVVQKLSASTFSNRLPAVK